MRWLFRVKWRPRLSRRGAELFATGLLLGVLVVVFYGTVVRYLPLPPGQMAWTEEIGRLLLVWLVFVSASVTMREGSHYKVDLVVRSLSPKARRIVVTLNEVITLVLLGFLVKAAISCHVMFATMRYSGFLELPRLAFFSPVLLCFVLMSVYACIRIVSLVRRSYQL